ncbi:hypothetical protein BP6252_01080 [Coleophoma cylindrospora]|uniref:RNA polymerase II holoenzyme cyclin-like subunit n=1 Tax=Coleophoma cylindrospora TaxID=1849047 RepID=A0A3D8STF6_9HELO|nr:hypothetical protein BP6252_01080 [Coleophoma cylindrospora]
MTITIDRHPSASIEESNQYRPASSDDPIAINSHGARSSTATIAKKKIPPAVPSPPPLSSRYSPPRSSAHRASPSPLRIMSSPTGASSNQWYFTEAEISSTPSVLDGLPRAEERNRRAKGVNFISQAGILLKLPQLTLATASIFFHRFYMRYSMVPEKGGLHHYENGRLPFSKAHATVVQPDRGLTFVQNIAATSLFLATKTEENCRKTKEIVIAVAKVAQKNASLIIDEQSKEYWRWRDNILLYEELMLELLTFDVVVESPYNHLYKILQSLELETNKALRNAAWGWINDSCLTMMCLLMPPRDIAVAAMYFAAKYTGEKIVDDAQGAPWWEREGGSASKIRRATAVMHEFYSENPLKKSQEQSPYIHGDRSEEDLDVTRRPASGAVADDSPVSGSHNGNSQEHISRSNGDQPTSNGNSSREEQQASKSISTEDRLGKGDSDSALKAVANNPATHEANGTANGMADLLPSSNGTTSPKRKADDTTENVAKRIKTDTGANEVAVAAPPSLESVDMLDVEEEGEVEE